MWMPRVGRMLKVGRPMNGGRLLLKPGTHKLKAGTHKGCPYRCTNHLAKQYPGSIPSSPFSPHW